MSVKYLIDQPNNNASFEIYVDGILRSSFSLNALTSNISLSPLLNDVVIPLSEHKSNIVTIKEFTLLCEKAFSLSKTKPNRHRQNYVKRPNESEGNFRILDYLFDMEYTHPTKEIRVKLREGTDFNWGSYLYFILFHETFVFEIERSY